MLQIWVFHVIKCYNFCKICYLLQNCFVKLNVKTNNDVDVEYTLLTCLSKKILRALMLPITIYKVLKLFNCAIVGHV